MLLFGAALDPKDSSLGRSWAKPDLTAFDPFPMVKLRFLMHPNPSAAIDDPSLPEVIHQFFGNRVDDEALGGEPFLIPGAYVQWVTAETQARRLEFEPEGPEYAFHRCLGQLNMFLTAYAIKYGRDDVFPVNTTQLGWLVTSGERLEDGAWRMTGPVLMHPDNVPLYPPEMAMDEDLGAGIAGCLEDIHYGHPYISARLWFDKSKRQGRAGDHESQTVSLQTSLESLIFSTWAMTMVDSGQTSQQIHAALSGFKTFESLFKTTIPRLLGGNWDRKDPSTAAYSYWQSLYLLRNRVVHTGYSPESTEAAAAEQGYRAIRSFVNDRLWDQRRRFPRTMFARLGRPELMGYQLDDFSRSFYETITRDEPNRWWLPFDVRN